MRIDSWAPACVSGFFAVALRASVDLDNPAIPDSRRKHPNEANNASA
jgi:hypothetical protein